MHEKYPSLTVCIPIYNEEACLESVLPPIIAQCRELGWQLILVNDGSKDQSGKILNAKFNIPGVRILHHKVNRGYGGAIKTAIESATSDFVCTMDADGQHRIEDIAKLLNKQIATDADMVIGRRYQEMSISSYRNLGKWLIRSVAKMLMTMPILDLNSGMKLYQTRLAKRYLHLYPDGMSFSDIIALVFLSQKHLVVEEDIEVRPRASGTSTINSLTALQTVREILNTVVLFNPQRIFLPASIFITLTGTLWGLPMILQNKGVSTGALMGILGGLIIFVLGLLAEQLSFIRKYSIQYEPIKIQVQGASGAKPAKANVPVGLDDDSIRNTPESYVRQRDPVSTTLP
jgi:glycosyltransferase involved in cell wall biosynthesis